MSTLKIAALILAHDSPELLRRLVQKVQAMGMSAFISIDMNSNSSALCDTIADLGVTVLRSTTSIRWGGFNIVDATLALVRAAAADDTLDGFLLMSGDTYPIKSGQICDVIDCSHDWIETFEINPKSDIFQRVARTYVPDFRVGAFALPFKDPLERFVDQAFLDNIEGVRASFHMKASRTFPWKLAKGSQWWLLRRGTLLRCLAALDEHADFISWFRYSSIPDESFFQTLVLNFSEHAPIMKGPIFVDWTRTPSPHVYRNKADLHILRTRPEPFARKFSAAHLDVIVEIDAWP